MKYKFLSQEVDDDGCVEVPNDLDVLGFMYHPVTGKAMAVLLKREPEKEPKPLEEEKEEKEKEEKEEGEGD